MLRHGASGEAVVQGALSLARLGTPEASEALATAAADPALPETVRAPALSGLGLLADPERLPSLALLREDVDYLAPTTLLNELYETL
jgi:hypothetical protein